jgi:hypothetical protein
MKVLLEEGVWLSSATWIAEGGPLRTLNEDNAAEFDSMEGAKQALKDARKYKPFKNATIEEDFI